MSRTDNTDPYWVKIRRLDPSQVEQTHRCTDPGGDDCDIDERYGRCRTWANIRIPGPQQGPTRDYRRDTWWGPRRAAARDENRNLAREWNAHRDIEHEPNPTHHRHNAKWFWF